jgi:small subunit ribosomal protein S17
MNVQEQSKMDNNTELLNNDVEETPVVNEPTAEVEVENISVENVPEVVTETETKQSSRKRVIVGKVKSNKGDKTITVTSQRQVIHPLYKKYYKVTKKVMAHDENNECKIGDTVKVIESRPLSKNKRWNLVEILERAK